MHRLNLYPHRGINDSTNCNVNHRRNDERRCRTERACGKRLRLCSESQVSLIEIHLKSSRQIKDKPIDQTRPWSIAQKLSCLPLCNDTFVALAKEKGRKGYERSGKNWEKRFVINEKDSHHLPK